MFGHRPLLSDTVLTLVGNADILMVVELHLILTRHLHQVMTHNIRDDRLNLQAVYVSLVGQ